MKITLKQIVYVMLIITGILIDRYGSGGDPQLDKYFGFGAIGLGSFNIVLDYFKKK
jgi:hypothetical protein